MEIIYQETANNECSVSTIVSDEKIVVIPDEIDGFKITEIDFASFELNNAVEIVLPKHLTHIDSNNFELCPKLKKVDFSKTQITEMTELLFSDCSNLEEVVLPEILETVKNLFNNCKSLKTIIIPDSVKEVNAAFTNCYIETLKIGKNVSSFIKSANCTCDNFIVDKKNKNFETENGFLYANDKTLLILAPKNIKNVSLPNELKSISDNAFSGATIESLDLRNVEHIGKSAFKNAKIKKLIANSVVSISSKCFENAHIDYIELKKLPFVDEFIFDKAYINKIILDSCTTLSSYAFSNTSFEDIFICPENLTVIDNYAFANAILEHIKFNDKLSEIGEQAFLGCLSNTTLDFPESLKIMKENAFTYSPYTNYNLNRDVEYINGIDLENVGVDCENIFSPIDVSQQKAFFSGTNLENKNISTFKSIEEYTKEGKSYKEINKLVKLKEKYDAR